MDLNSDEAQKVLDNGLTCEGKKQVYSYHNEKMYEFQPDNAGTYHGYPVPGTEVPHEILKQLRSNGTINEAKYNKLRKESKGV